MDLVHLDLLAWDLSDLVLWVMVLWAIDLVVGLEALHVDLEPLVKILVLLVGIAHSDLVFEAGFLCMTDHIGFVGFHCLDEGIYSDQETVVVYWYHIDSFGHLFVLDHMIVGWTYFLIHLDWLAAKMVDLVPGFENSYLHLMNCYC